MIAAAENDRRMAKRAEARAAVIPIIRAPV
jgi:hypothetical protein